MLRELHLTGLGVIEDVELELHPGLNVLTGETGAGKTMVTVGLALALGRRASASLVRAGAEAARVQARFEPVAADIAPAWASDGELVLARAVAAEGRGSARINAELVPVSALAELAPALVEVHGQHEGIALLSPAAQLAFVDRYAGTAHLEQVRALAEAHADLRAARRDLDDLRERERDRERELDLLRYQARDIATAAPRPGELEALVTEEARLGHVERLLDRATAAERALDAEDAGTDALAAAAEALSGVADVDAGAASLAEAAAELLAAATELARDVRAYRESLDVDPARLAEVEERISVIRALLRRYGDTEDDVLTFLADVERRLATLERGEEALAEADERVTTASARVEALAVEVSRGRTQASPRLAAAVGAELRDLGMPDAAVEVALLPLEEIGSNGAERVEFRFAAGVGQVPMPLAKVASGGELSRTMLACRSVLADLDDVPTLVFDEVDAGIGGLAGVAVGRRLAALAARRQVLVVTHLPQIASFADRHLRVEKVAGTATVTVLDDAGRVAELTRMLSGLPESEAAATHAEELLAEAGKAKARG
jgi:DNA repair protein RecN (Recombination protein N)